MSKNVMIVDDDKDILRTTQFVLEKNGYSVITANSGNQCLANLDQGFSGLILMDVMMPEMTGWETVLNIVKNNHQEKVIICMMTCVTDPEDEAAHATQYITGYITKPFTHEELAKISNFYLQYLKAANEN